MSQLARRKTIDPAAVEMVFNYPNNKYKRPPNIHKKINLNNNDTYYLTTTKLPTCTSRIFRTVSRHRTPPQYTRLPNPKKLSENPNFKVLNVSPRFASFGYII